MSYENSACRIPVTHKILSDENSACRIPVTHKILSDGDVEVNLLSQQLYVLSLCPTTVPGGGSRPLFSPAATVNDIRS